MLIYDLIIIIFSYYNDSIETIPYVHDFRDEKFYTKKRHSDRIQLKGISDPEYYINTRHLNDLRAVIGVLLKNKPITIKKKRLKEIEEFAKQIGLYFSEKDEYQTHKGQIGSFTKNRVRLTIHVNISLLELRNVLLP